MTAHDPLVCRIADELPPVCPGCITLARAAGDDMADILHALALRILAARRDGLVTAHQTAVMLALADGLRGAIVAATRPGEVTA